MPVTRRPFGAGTRPCYGGGQLQEANLLKSSFFGSLSLRNFKDAFELFPLNISFSGTRRKIRFKIEYGGANYPHHSQPWDNLRLQNLKDQRLLDNSNPQLLHRTHLSKGIRLGPRASGQFMVRIST